MHTKFIPRLKMETVLKVTIIVYVALFFDFFLVASFDNLGPRLASSHGISLEKLSVIQSVKSFVNMAMGPVFALSSSKLPTTLLFTVGSFGIVAAYTGIAFAVSEAGFYTARVLHGIGTSGLMIGGMSVLMRCVPKKKRGKYTSIAFSSVGHSTLVAPILSGVMYDKLGQTWTFLIPAITALTCACVSYILLMRAVATPSYDSTDSGIQSIRKSDMWPCVVQIFTNPMTFLVLVGIFSDGFSFGSCESTLPAILTEWDGHSLDVVTASLIYSVGPLVFTICAPIAGWFVDRVGHYKVMIFGLCMFVIFFPLFQLFDDTLVGLGACFAIAFGIVAIVEVSVYPCIAAIVESTNIANAEAIGFALGDMCIQAGFAIGNLAGRRLYDWGGMLAMGVFIAGWDGLVILISLLIMWFYPRKKLADKECKVEDTPDTLHDTSITVNQP